MQGIVIVVVYIYVAAIYFTRSTGAHVYAKYRNCGVCSCYYLFIFICRTGAHVYRNCGGM